MRGRPGLVRTTDRRIVRSTPEKVRIRYGFTGDSSHGSDEGIQSLDGFRFRRLDHDGLVKEQREIDRRSVEAVVQQSLGHVQGRDFAVRITGIGLSDAVKYEFMLAQGLHRQFVSVLERLLDIVGCQHGKRSCFPHIFVSE